jgi:hypothetical protein
LKKEKEKEKKGGIKLTKKKKVPVLLPKSPTFPSSSNKRNVIPYNRRDWLENNQRKIIDL